MQVHRLDAKCVLSFRVDRTTCFVRSPPGQHGDLVSHVGELPKDVRATIRLTQLLICSFEFAPLFNQLG